MDENIKKYLDSLIDRIFKNVPCGVGSRSRLRVSDKEIDELLATGGKWAVKHNFGTEEDLKYIEENGCIEGGDPSKVSREAKERGKPQIGTLGAGNHFLEIQKVSHIFDEKIAKKFGIERVGQITIMVHCGSRGLGHQVATDYFKIHEKACQKYGIKLPDKQLVCAPANSPEGQSYFSAMKCAANYAFCNRIMITHWIRESFSSVLGKSWESLDIKYVYDVCHNICKLEEYIINGKKRELYVHRKGATRAFPEGHSGTPEVYKDVGQPVFIAGSMGTASYILVGTELAIKEAFGSSCHGSGRTLSCAEASRKYRGERIKSELEKDGKILRATHNKILAEEAPYAYKDVDEVVNSVHEAGISKKVARMVPLAIAKG